MTRERLIAVIDNIQYSRLHPADRRVLNDFLNQKKREIADRYIELTKRAQEPESNDKPS